jgi:hypothetical protein
MDKIVKNNTSFEITDRKKLTVYLPHPLVRSLKIQAAQLGSMSYSGIAESNIKKILKEIEGLKDFAELSNSPKYKDRLKEFIPVKRGRPPIDRKIIIKKKITFYISLNFFKIIRRNQRHFNLSESSLIEMALILSS